VEIKIRCNVKLAEIPSTIALKEGACMRDALLRATPQVVDKKTGEYIDDPDFWDIRLNEVPLYQLNEGLNTRIRNGDVIRLEILFHYS
jgi:hypothetical protein